MEVLLDNFSTGRSLAVVFGGAFLCLFIYSLYDVVTSKFLGNEGMLWALLIFFAPGIGVLAYLVFGRQRRLKKQI